MDFLNGERNMVNGLSQAAIGRALGLSPAAMTKLKYQGMPVDSIESAQAWREARQNIAARKQLPPAEKASAPPATPVPSGIQEEDFHQARTRREIADANLAEIKEGELRGDLIRISSVKATLAAVFATTRDALLQIPSRLAPLLAADADPASVQNMLHGEIHQALMTLAGSSARIGETESSIE